MRNKRGMLNRIDGYLLLRKKNLILDTMKNLSDLEMKSINGGVPQAYYLDADVIKATGKLLKRGLSLLGELFTLWNAID